MAEEKDTRSEYEVTINGLPHTMLLDEEDAARYGEQAKRAGSGTKAKTPANKARTARDK